MPNPYTECPRCRGIAVEPVWSHEHRRGHLKPCASCDGRGKVTPKLASEIRVDVEREAASALKRSTA